MRKIAVVTKDEEKVSAHFGMAPLYRVFSVEAGQIVAVETREKPHHKKHPEHHHSQDHGHGQHRHGRDHHDDMFAPIADCQVLICGGMGGGAHAKAQAASLEIVLTSGPIEAVVQAYLNGEISSDARRIHIH